MMRRSISLHKATTSGPAPKRLRQTPFPWLLIRQRQQMRSISVRSSSGNPVATLHLRNPFPISLAKTKTTIIPGDQTVSKIPTFLYHHRRALGRISLQCLKQRPACSLLHLASQTCTPSLSPLQCAIQPTPRPPNVPAYPISTSVSAISHRSPRFPSIPILSAPCTSQQEQRKASFVVKLVHKILRRAFRTSCSLVHY